MEEPIVLDSGSCSWGYAQELIEIPAGKVHPMAGHSATGSFGKTMDPDAPLQMKVLVINDGDDEVIICFMDILSGSIALMQRLRKLLPNDHDRIALVGSHTHYAPGKYFGSSYFDTLAQPVIETEPLLQGPKLEVIELYATTLVKAIQAARLDLKPGRIGVIKSRLWKTGANRSYDAFKNNGTLFSDWNISGTMPGFPTPTDDDLDPLEKAIDPRIFTILATNEDGTNVCAFSTASSHTTAMGPYSEVYSADWPGVAAKHVQDAAPAGATFHSAFVMGAGGDVSSLDTDLLKSTSGGKNAGQGIELRDRRGREYGQFLGKVINKVLPEVTGGSSSSIAVKFKSSSWDPEGMYGPPFPGWPTIAGAEDGHGKRAGAAFEGSRIPKPRRPWHNPFQYPKRIVGGALFEIFGITETTLGLAPEHPVCQIRIGNHLFLTAPGEITSMSGYFLESRLGGHSTEPITVSVVSNTNDYMGYITTPLEYRAQHYEGSSTLFGIKSLGSLITAHKKLLSSTDSSGFDLTSSTDHFAAAESASTESVASAESIGGADDTGVNADRIAQYRTRRAEILEQLEHSPVILVEPFANSDDEKKEFVNDQLAKELAEVDELTSQMEQEAGYDADQDSVELEGFGSDEGRVEVYVVFNTEDDFDREQGQLFDAAGNGYDSQQIFNFGDVVGNGKDVRAAVFLLPGDPPEPETLSFSFKTL